MNSHRNNTYVCMCEFFSYSCVVAIICQLEHLTSSLRYCKGINNKYICALLLCHRQPMAECRMQPCKLKYECQWRIKYEQIKSQVAINCLKSNGKSYQNPSEYNRRAHKYDDTLTYIHIHTI